MPALYDSADIFINASVVDNMPLSLIEAFACGLAVATTGAGGIPYIVAHEKTGKVVDPGDYVALAREVLSLIDDQPSAQELIANARADSELYTWEAVRTAWISMYQDLSGADRSIGPLMRARPGSGQKGTGEGNGARDRQRPTHARQVSSMRFAEHAGTIVAPAGYQDNDQ
jgi:hypothetical protein